MSGENNPLTSLYKNKIEMTNEELKAIGIINCGHSFNKRKFIFPIDEMGERTIPENYKIADVLNMIHKDGYEKGKIAGRKNFKERIRELFQSDEFE